MLRENKGPGSIGAPMQDAVEGLARRLTAGIKAARENLLARQDDTGWWCHELEADCTIPAEYILMLHYFGEREPALEARMANYLRRWQGADGGWPLYEAGALDISCSVKAYFALKLAGDDPQASHMRRAREAILAAGGAARANVFTRIALALFGELPWLGVPFVPVEVVLLPDWFPLNLHKVSYWSRTVVVPLAVLCSLKPRAANPGDVHVRELFVTPPERETRYFAPPGSPLAWFFLQLDKVGRALEPRLPKRLRRKALQRAERWMLQRLNGRGGLGAIFPAMVNACEALQLLGYANDHPLQREARQALRDLIVERETEAYCQPCVSPVWDTGLTCLAMQEDLRGSASPDLDAAVQRALAWLRDCQLLEQPGDWQHAAPRLRGGGWAFQFRNDAYPDLDDTAVVAWVMDQAPDRECDAERIRRATDWLVGMQSSNGGFAAFDIDNNRDWLNQIPFADHGALLDPPTSDVSARVLTLLARLDRPGDRQAREGVLAFLRAEQTEDGAWFGRWGSNYIYGTWSVLVALSAAGIPAQAPEVRRAVGWLKRCQRQDGSWGETNDTYFDPTLAGTDDRGNAAQTSWALLALMAVGEAGSTEVERGIEWLLQQQQEGRWIDAAFNAPGFPRVFYLKYHGYSHYFPYWALARFRNVRGSLAE